MKVVTPKQMRQVEEQAYADGVSPSDLMEEAGSGVALLIQDFIEESEGVRKVCFLCGRGNNGGDGYVAALHLLHLDYEVLVIDVDPSREKSPLCFSHHQQFIEEGGKLLPYQNHHPLPNLTEGVIVDALFGSGFHGTIEEPYLSTIRWANSLKLPIIAIDIPSGLDGESGKVHSEAIIAQATVFLGLPKQGFFLGEGWNHTGKLHGIDFGLPQKYFASLASSMKMLTREQVKEWLPQVRRNRHKYERGVVVGWGGSSGMVGAAILAAMSALQSGAGLVRLLHAKELEGAFAAAPLELVRLAIDDHEPAQLLEALNKGDATFLGPGLGRSPHLRELLEKLMPELARPCVIDADALTLLADAEISYPSTTILTPHLGELARLMQKKAPLQRDQQFLQEGQQFAEENRVTLLAKGAPTFIFHPGEPITVNPTGDPGMATAGSGDLLTGMIAAFLSQKLPAYQAASLAVFLHGIAGEAASRDLTCHCVTASDLLFYFPEAFRLKR